MPSEMSPQIHQDSEPTWCKNQNIIGMIINLFFNKNTTEIPFEKNVAQLTVITTKWHKVLGIHLQQGIPDATRTLGENRVLFSPSIINAADTKQIACYNNDNILS